MKVGTSATKWLAALRALPNDSPLKTVIVVLAVSLAGSVLVAGSAVLLRPLHLANKALERQRHFMGVVERLPDVGPRIAAGEAGRVEGRVVDLATGEYVPSIDARRYDQRRAAEDPDRSVAIPPRLDEAQIGRRAKLAVVYLVELDGRLRAIILPVRGKGYASTLYGYLGLDTDAESVISLNFYEHAETPGLGALIDTPAWQNQWRGKKVWDASGNPALGVARGPVAPGSPEAQFKVDGITGATWTSQGVSNLLRYWLGNHGFGPYLRRMRKTRG